MKYFTGMSYKTQKIYNEDFLELDGHGVKLLITKKTINGRIYCDISSIKSLLWVLYTSSNWNGFDS